MKGMVNMKKIKTLTIMCVAVAVLATGAVSTWAYGAFNPVEPAEAEIVQPAQQVNAVQLSIANAVPLSFANTGFEDLQSEENDWAVDFFDKYGDLTLSEAIEQIFTMFSTQSEEQLSAAIADGAITDEQSMEILARNPVSLITKLSENELFNKYRDVTLNELRERFPEIRQEIEAIQLDGEKRTVGEQMANLSEMTLGEALDAMKAGMDEKLATALADGTIAQEQADRIREQAGDETISDNEIFKEYKDMKLSELMQILPQIMENGTGAIGENLNGVNISDMLDQYGEMTLGEAMEEINIDMHTSDDPSSLKERLDAAVTEGKITQEHADEVLANLSQKSILDSDFLNQYKDVKVSELGSVLPEIMKGFMR